MMKNRKLTGKQKLERRKEIIVESLKLPKDSMLGASIVTVTGNKDAFVENYKGILYKLKHTLSPLLLPHINAHNILQTADSK